MTMEEQVGCWSWRHVGGGGGGGGKVLLLLLLVVQPQKKRQGSMAVLWERHWSID